MHHKKMSGGTGDISLPDVSKLNDLKDEQIEALIEKLAEVQAHAPQIIAALEAQQEARSRGSRGSKGGGANANERKSDRGERTQPPKARQPTVEEEEEDDDDDDDDDDDEDDDDFDEDAEYPMVGDGYSDELSVVSDMTTPTVVSSLEINEEEYYRDMMVGAGMKMNAPKKKDLLSQVAKTNARKTVAAAPAKKKTAAADSQLKKPARAASLVKGAPAPAAKTDPTMKKKKSKDGTSTTPTGTKKVKKKKDGTTSTKKKEAAGGGPSASGGKKKGPQEKAAPVMIDDDGFLVDQSTFESFDSSNNPFARAPSFTAGNATDDEDAFGAFASFGDPEPAPRKTTKPPKKLNVTSTGTTRKKKSSGSASINDAPNSPKSKRKGDRRLSVGM